MTAYIPTALTYSDLRGAPLVTLGPADVGALFSGHRRICDLCRKRPALIAFGYHPGEFCDSCATIIWSGLDIDNDGVGCRCPDWTPQARDMHLKATNRRIADPRDEYTEGDALALWKCEHTDIDPTSGPSPA